VIEQKRVTVISPLIFVFVSVVYWGIVAASVHKYLTGRDPYYPLQAVAYVLIWLLYLYIFRRGRKSRQGVDVPATKR
jgi:hypothetical protein